jgi:hypothetical protein
MPESDEQQPTQPQKSAPAQDGFFKRMLRKALQTSTPDLDEVRALLTLLQRDGDNPEEVYLEVSAQVTSDFPPPPDYQIVAPEHSSAGGEE